MAELKFRAWDKKENKWLFGYEYPNLGGFSLIGETILMGEFGSLALEKLMNDVVIMQYTGLKDKNGIEIYEGDIGEIKTQSGRIDRFVVKWGIHRRKMASGWEVDIPGFCFWIDNFPSFPIANNYNNGHDLDIISIIGNIYENPDLIPQT